MDAKSDASKERETDKGMWQEVVRTVSTYLRKGRDSPATREKIRRLIREIDVKPLVNRLFYSDDNIVLPREDFEIWGYIAGMAGLAEEMSGIFTQMLKDGKTKGEVIVITFLDTQDVDVSLALIRDFNMKYEYDELMWGF